MGVGLVNLTIQRIINGHVNSNLYRPFSLVYKRTTHPPALIFSVNIFKNVGEGEREREPKSVDVGRRLY